VIIIGWSLTFLLPLAMLAFGTVTQGDDGPWMFSLFFLAPLVTLGFLLLAAAWRRLPEHRLIGLVHIVSVVVAFRMLPGYWRRVTLARDHIGAGFSPDNIGSFAPEWWHFHWAPAMTLLLFCAVLFNVLAWTRRATG
jgi:RsiW-degrading membrane proteinase PrsW (M82 family)